MNIKVYQWLYFYGCFLCIPICFQCSVRYDKLIQKTENYFFQSEFTAAIDHIKPIVQASQKKDILLYLLETALIFHTQGNFQKSNEFLIKANHIIQKAKKSISRETLAFLLSDREKLYIGENFERSLIKFYIALNYLLMKNWDSARKYLKKIQFEQKDLKYFDATYKQNLMARYLSAILAEKLEDYNNARVEYKNINLLQKDKKKVISDQYVLALKEKDNQDIRRYTAGKFGVAAYNTSLKKISYAHNMGELVVIHQAGKSAIKKSRGQLINDEAFIASLNIAIRIAIINKGATLTVASVMSTLYSAENPISTYQLRTHKKNSNLLIYLNTQNIGQTLLFNDYSRTVIKNFNDNYTKMIAKNIASIALKAVSAAITSYAIDMGVAKASGSAAVGTVAGILAGVLAGASVGSTIKPDLRCWRLLPSTFQVKRIFLESGKYQFMFKTNDQSRILTNNSILKINIKKGDLIFVTVRSI